MVKDTKIKITNQPERFADIKITEGERRLLQTKEREESEKQIEQMYRDEMDKIRPPASNSRSIIFLTIILSLIFSLIAGGLGSFLLLTQEKINIPFLGQIDTKKYSPTKEVNLVTEKNVTVTQDLRLAELSTAFANQLVNVFPQKTISVGAKTNLLDKLYAPQNALGNGLALTNDGWIIFSKKIIPDLQKKYVTAVDHSVSPVEKMVADPIDEIIFAKSSLNNISAVKIANRDDLSAGQQVLIFAPDNSLSVNQISQLGYREIKQPQDLLYSTDQFNDYLLLETPMADKFIGSPVFILDKSAIGILVDKNLVRPFYRLNNIVLLVLSNQPITRPYLGLNYLNLAEINGSADPQFNNSDSGDLVWGDPIKNSPADKAGLMDQNLITKVDGLPLNNYYNFTEIVQSHRPGESIDLTIIRQGVEKSIKIILEGK